MITSQLSAHHAPAAADSSKLNVYSLQVESAEVSWLLLTFTSWAFLRVEVDHGFVLKPTCLTLTTTDSQLTPGELRWLVVDVLRSPLAAYTLESEQLGTLTPENAGTPPRQATMELLDRQVRRFLDVHAPGEVAQQYLPASDASTIDEAATRLRVGLLQCAEATSGD